MESKGGHWKIDVCFSFAGAVSGPKILWLAFSRGRMHDSECCRVGGSRLGLEGCIYMAQELPASAQRVQTMLRERGFAARVVELPASTRTASEAARAIGCAVEQIVKSLVFRGTLSSQPVLVVASGSNRVNEQRIGELLGEPIEKADAEFVRKRTGFAIGGVPPLGHSERLRTFIDEDLLQYPQIWAAAGTPHAVFQLTAAELREMTGGQMISVR
jgi:prolyl-tRNA editing enzyme YbaK/EbsC (Cys-tRNA(Pro) deacylase)